MSEKISIMIRNLWKVLKEPYKSRYGPFLFFVPTCLFITNLFINHWVISTTAWLLYFPVIYLNNKGHWKIIRKLQKNEVWIWCREDRFYWEKIDKRYIMKDGNTWYVNPLELYDNYKFSGIEIIDEFIKQHNKNLVGSALSETSLIKLETYKKGVEIKLDIDKEIFKINNREKAIDELL